MEALDTDRFHATATEAIALKALVREIERIKGEAVARIRPLEEQARVVMRAAAERLERDDIAFDPTGDGAFVVAKE